MTPIDDQSFEFDGCTLNPRDRLLFHFNKRVELADKDFDILVYMVQNPNLLIKNEDLEIAVWGAGTNLRRGNITNHMAKIRKVLGCDPRNPRFIETNHAKRSYRFIAKVRHVQKEVLEAAASKQATHELAIESHLIAPVFLGPRAFDNIRGPEKETTWAKYKELKIENGRLCMFSTGIGVWHLTGKHQFSSFANVARWRYETYARILKGKHTIQIYNQELRVPLISRSSNIFGAVLGKIGYVFSVIGLEKQTWARTGKLRTPLRLLSYLSPLENPTINSVEKSSLEQKLLAGLYADVETREFGSPGQDMGFATWDGVSYLQQADGRSTIKSDIIEFEIAVQSAWWLAKCLYDICMANGSKVKKDLTLAIQDMKWQYAKVKGIVATESTGQRTMIEAVIATSRLHRLVEDTIKLYDQL